jgi:molybdenum cofactor cytidylyltransferase
VPQTTQAASVAQALGLTHGSGIVAIVGGGGKTSLMFALARCLPGRVVTTTTTRIFATQMSQADEVCSLADADWRARLDEAGSSLLVVARVDGDRAVGVPRDLPAEMLAHPGVDWVVVEADGSRMRPVKAPAEHEPVIPDETGLLVAVAGIDALTGPIQAVAHRPEIASALVGLSPEQTLSPKALAALLTSSRGGLKGAPATARAALLINKVESPTQREAARQVARHGLREPRLERVAIGSLAAGSSSWWEIHTR